MDRIASFSKSQLRELFNETAIKKQVTPAIVEKDFWVTWVLSKIFADEYLSKILVFKGGTSLSKVFKILERFSEDIDLILDWNTVTQDNPLLTRSNSQQNKFNQSLNDSAHEFMQDQILPRLNKLLQPGYAGRLTRSIVPAHAPCTAYARLSRRIVRHARIQLELWFGNITILKPTGNPSSQAYQCLNEKPGNAGESEPVAEKPRPPDSRCRWDFRLIVPIDFPRFDFTTVKRLA